jgi:hypothetical protein
LSVNRFGNVLLNVREPQLAESRPEGAEAIQVDARSSQLLDQPFRAALTSASKAARSSSGIA